MRFGTARSIVVYAITGVLILLVIHQVGFTELTDTLRQGNFTFVILCIGIGQTSILINIYKWQLLLRARGQFVSLRHLWSLYLVGTFFNNFLPTNVGGDLVRGYELGRDLQNPALGLASVFVERFTGFIVLIGLTVVSFLALTQYHLTDNPLLVAALFFASTGLLGAMWIILDRRLLAFVERRIRWRLVAKYISKFKRFQLALHEVAQNRMVLLRAVGLSCCFYIGVYVYVYFAMRAFHEDVWFVGIALIVPITNLVSFVPLTLNGIGLTELAYVLLFPMIGVPAPAALSGIVVIRASTAVSAMLGGIIYSRLRAGTRGAVASPVSVS